jgi:hypothetical protein
VDEKKDTTTKKALDGGGAGVYKEGAGTVRAGRAAETRSGQTGSTGRAGQGRAGKKKEKRKKSLTAEKARCTIAGQGKQRNARRKKWQLLT